MIKKSARFEITAGVTGFQPVLGFFAAGIPERHVLSLSMSGGPGAGRWHAKLRRKGSETGQRGGKREKGGIRIDAGLRIRVHRCREKERRLFLKKGARANLLLGMGLSPILYVRIRVQIQYLSFANFTSFEFNVSTVAIYLFV